MTLLAWEMTYVLQPCTSELILIFFKHWHAITKTAALSCNNDLFSCSFLVRDASRHDYTTKLCGQMHPRPPRQVFKLSHLHLHLALITFDQIVQVKSIFVL